MIDLDLVHSGFGLASSHHLTWFGERLNEAFDEEQQVCNYAASCSVHLQGGCMVFALISAILINGLLSFSPLSTLLAA